MWYLFRDSRLQFGMHYISITFCKFVFSGWCVLALLGHVFSPELSQEMTPGLFSIKARPKNGMPLTYASSHLFLCVMLFGVECTNTNIKSNFQKYFQLNFCEYQLSSPGILTDYFLCYVLSPWFRVLKKKKKTNNNEKHK